MSIKVYREPEVRVRLGGESIVEGAHPEFELNSAESWPVEVPPPEERWWLAPRMNGYNVHDGIVVERPLDDGCDE